MKKLKIGLLGIAACTAIVTAYATRPKVDCTFADQYYFNGVTYIPAGQYGTDYSCLNFPGVCTYYKPDPVLHPDTYAPCRLGRIWIIE